MSAQVHNGVIRNDAVEDVKSPSPVRAEAHPASPPVGRGATARPLILPRPTGGEAGTALFRGRVRERPISQLQYSKLGT